MARRTRKKIPDIRVGSKKVTYTRPGPDQDFGNPQGADFRCEILALRVDGTEVDSIHPDAIPNSRRDIRADLKLPDGSVRKNVPDKWNDEAPQLGSWCRPWLSSVTFR